MHFRDRMVILTGVGREGQVGEVVAGTFADHGARMILIDRTPAHVEARAAALRGAGHDVRSYACDLTDEAETGVVAGKIATTCGGRVDALVHLAGGFAFSGRVDESDVAVWHRQLAINLTTAYVVTRAFLPLLRPSRGAIVYFASAAALPGADTTGMVAYVTAKAGVLALMRTVAREERATGVRANALAPTAIRTAANIESMGEETVHYIEREQVAETVMFLCSEEARAISGQVVGMG